MFIYLYIHTQFKDSLSVIKNYAELKSLCSGNPPLYPQIKVITMYYSHAYGDRLGSLVEGSDTLVSALTVQRHKIIFGCENKL
jgi:hypothetical protein